MKQTKNKQKNNLSETHQLNNKNYEEKSLVLQIITVLISIVALFVSFWSLDVAKENLRIVKDIQLTFLPVQLNDMVPSKEIIIVGDSDTVFTTKGFEIKKILDQISGKPKYVGVAGATPSENMDSGEIELNIVEVKSYNESSKLVLDLTGYQNAELSLHIPDIEKGDDVVRIVPAFGIGHTTNLLYLIVEDFNDSITIVTYVLYSKPKQDNTRLLTYHPIKHRDFKNLDVLYKLYSKIDFEEDLFWKDYSIHSLSDFKKYLETNYSKVKEQFQ